MLEDIGFVRVAIKLKAESREYIQHWMPGSGAEEYVVAAEVTAMKPSTLASTVYNAFKFIRELAYDAWLVQARHHALHTDAPCVEEPGVCAPGPARAPASQC